jgi:hypothetical protein
LAYTPQGIISKISEVSDIINGSSTDSSFGLIEEERIELKGQLKNATINGVNSRETQDGYDSTKPTTWELDLGETDLKCV